MIPEELSDGKIVRIGGLSSFCISLSSHGHEAEENVNSKTIWGAKLLFDPDKKFDRMLDGFTYEKTS